VNIPDRRSKQAERVVIALAQSMTPEDGQIIMTETCRAFELCVSQTFLTVEVLNVNVSVFYKKCMSWFLSKVIV
jgi:hypothetical protein